MRFIALFTGICLLIGLAAGVSAQPKPDFSGVWEFEAWSTQGWPSEPPCNTAGRTAQDRWAAKPQDDPSLRCIIPPGRIISAASECLPSLLSMIRSTIRDHGQSKQVEQLS